MEFDEGMNVHVDTIRLSEYDVDVEATISYNLGQGYRQNNDEYSSERAEAYYQTCLEKCDKICELRVIALHNSGMIQYERGKTRDAIQTFTKVLGLAKLVWGHDHTNVATCYNCLGVLHYHLLSSNVSTERDLNLAWHYSNAALDIQRAQFGRDHQNVATIYNNMGRLHVLNDQFEQALEMYEEALSIRGKVLGKDSLDYAATAFNAGQSYHQAGNLVQALELYNIFLSVASDKLSRNHRDIAVVLSGIAQIHQENGDHEDALKVSSINSSQFLLLFKMYMTL
jgi:tetratricopeptide (TPR) repeat protein